MATHNSTAAALNIDKALDSTKNLNATNRARIVTYGGTATAPPGSPVDGDRYLVVATASGDFAGQEGKIAAFFNGAWGFYTIDRNWILLNTESKKSVSLNSTADAAIDSEIPASSFVIYYSESDGKIKVRAKKADGTVLNADVATLA